VVYLSVIRNAILFAQPLEVTCRSRKFVPNKRGETSSMEGGSHLIGGYCIPFDVKRSKLV